VRPAFEWNVKNFSHLQAVDSEPFEAGGVKWRIELVTPGISKSEHLAMFLRVDDPQSLPVLDDTRSFVRRRWSERECVGCAGGMAMLRKLRARDMEPPDARSGDEEGAGHVLCGEVRPPAAGLGLTGVLAFGR
jgi:hypothetical protein